jgi:hypothetical protein
MPDGYAIVKLADAKYASLRLMAESLLAESAAKIIKKNPKRRNVYIERLLVTTCIRRLRGAAIVDCAERAMFFRIIGQAIEDASGLHDTDKQVHKYKARRYLFESTCAGHCWLVGLDHEYLKNTLAVFFPWAARPC